MDDHSILIIGSGGQLGQALKQKYPNANAVDSAELDITSEAQVNGFDFKPYKVVLNAAAYTNVDGAETAEGRVSAWQVNAKSVSLLVKALLKQDSVFVHISTDYVFDGTKADHKEDEPLSPLGVYGQSKAAGDLALSVLPKYYLLRTSWVIGEGNNFVRTMLGLAQKGVSPTVVSDAEGRPTFTNELVRAIDHLLNNGAAYGVYNVTNGGNSVSWADLARETFKLSGAQVQVTDTTNDAYFSEKPGSAPRPLNSTFDLSKIQSSGFSLTDWHKDLEDYVKKENQKT